MYKYQLNDVEWGEFILGQLFSIKKVYGKTSKEYAKGKFPYISTSSADNGVIDFVKKNEGKEISKGGAISIDPIGGYMFLSWL